MNEKWSIYYEGLTKKKKAAANKAGCWDYFYLRIRVSSYVRAAALSVCAVMCFILAFSLFETLFNEFEFAKNCWIHFVRNDTFDISRLTALTGPACAFAGAVAVYVILSIVLFFRSRIINKRSCSFN